MSKSLPMTELRFTVNTDFMNKLRKRLQVERGTDIARSALTLLDWASEETSSGRVILSSTSEGTEVHRLVMPELKRSENP